MATEERVKLTVRLKPELHKRVHHRAIDDEVTVQVLVERALDAFLKGRGR